MPESVSRPPFVVAIVPGWYAAPSRRAREPLQGDANAPDGFLVRVELAGERLVDLGEHALEDRQPELEDLLARRCQREQRRAAVARVGVFADVAALDQPRDEVA